MFFEELENYQKNIALKDCRGNQLTYSEMVAKARLICCDVWSRSLTMMLCKNDLEAVCGYVGLQCKKSVPIMVDSELEEALIDGLLQTYEPNYIYCPKEKACKFGIENVLWEGTEYILLQRNESEIPAMHPELALLLTTSGSTGSPKLVRQTYQNIEENAKAIVAYLDIDENEKAITTLPMNYTYGLSVIHSHLMAGATILMNSYPMNNKWFWEFFQKEEATSFGGVPYTYEMLKKIRFMKMDLPSLKTMTQAGGKLSPDLHEEFARYAEHSGKKFIVMYGQTEATARMAYLPATDAVRKKGSIGIPIPGGEMYLVDTQGKVILEADVAGELIYRGKNVTLGYAESRNDLDAPDYFCGILNTGDIAKRDNDGYYYIVGRKKRFLKIYGSRVNLDEIDMLVKHQYPNIECATTGKDDFMVTYITDEKRLGAVKELIVGATHINAAAVEIRYCRELPKNDAGKILYKILEERTWRK